MAEFTVKGDSVRTEISSVGLPPKMERSEPASANNWRQRAQRLQKEAHVFYFVFRHPRTRWYARMVAACTAGYVLSPVQLIPNYLPVVGVMDDVLVVFVGAKLLRKITPPDILSECRDLANAAEVRRKEEARWVSAAVVPVVITTVWVLAAITASALFAVYIYH